MPSTDITTCASPHCPKRWRCAEHFTNNVIDSMYASHYDAYRTKIGECEHFREIKETTT